MSGLEKSSWNSSLQAQYDQTVRDLLILMDAQDSLRDQIEAQEALIALLAALLAPLDRAFFYYSSMAGSSKS